MAGGSELIVKITGKDVGLKSVLNQAGDDVGHFGNRVDGLGSKLASFGKVAALGMAGAAVGVGAFLKSSVEAAEESRKVMAQTEAVLKSTGGMANVTAAGVDKLSSSLSAMSGIDDEVISKGQNLLLTFTNVRNEVGKGNDIFDQGTKAALNMSVALGTDMSSASMLVGKALNDPIAGMTALTRSGVQFTQQQKDQIKAMVAAGDTLGAQKVILKELETQFAGSAEAAASPMARLKVVVGNLQEELGARLLPVVATVATFLADRLPAALDRAGAFIGPIIEKIGLFVGAFRAAFSGEGITSDGAVGVFERIGVAAKAVIDWFVANWPQIQATVSSVLDTVGAVISGFVDVVSTIWENFGSQIMSMVTAAWEFVRSTIGAAMDAIQGIVKVVTGIIHGDWSMVWEGIKQILSGAWDFIVARIEFAIAMIKNVISIGMEIIGSTVRGAFDGIVGFVASIPGRILDALGNLGGLLYDAGRALITGLLNGIKDAVQGVYNFVSGIAGKIASLKGPIEKDRKLLIPAGQAIMDSLVTGLRNHESHLVSQLAHTTGLINGVSAGNLSAVGSSGAMGSTSGISSSSGSPGAGAKNITINITVSGSVDPQHLAREIAWAMG